MPESPADMGYPAHAEIVGIAGLQSVPAAFARTVHRFPDGVAYRTIDDSIRLTWSQLATKVSTWAAALAGVGVKRYDTVATLMVNRPEHLIADLANVHLGAVSTSIYNTMPASELAQVLADSGAHVLVTQAAFLPRVRDAVCEHGLQLDTVVVFDSEAGDLDLPGVTTYTPEEFLACSPPDEFDFERSWKAVELDDICHVIYTSGTTGTPKGVELSHRSALRGADVYRVAAPVEPGQRLLSAFPLAHAAERAVTYYLPVLQGHCVTFCPDVRLLSDYYLQVRPAYVFMTPRSLERFKATIDRNVALEESPTRRELMRRAIDLGIEVFSAEQAGVPVDSAVQSEWESTKTIRSEILATVGLDGVVYAGVGSAPVTLELMAYFVGLGMAAREGWGLTETGATTALGLLSEPYRVGYCGRATPGMEIKLAPDNEVLVRGAGMMTRYRNKPEATAAAFDEDGWFKTGDLGVLNELGQLRMVDRKKELIINANGKNMSPVKIESKVKNSGSLVGQIVAIGDSRPYLTALILLDPEGVEVFQRENGIPDGTPMEILAKEPSLIAAVQLQIDRANADLGDVEQIRKWTLLTEDWVPGGEELTPTMKLRRRAIVSKYATRIDGLYQ